MGGPSARLSLHSRRARSTKIIIKTDQKGYVRLVTSLGDINIELHCDMVPKAVRVIVGARARRPTRLSLCSAKTFCCWPNAATTTARFSTAASKTL